MLTAINTIAVSAARIIGMWNPIIKNRLFHAIRHEVLLRAAKRPVHSSIEHIGLQDLHEPMVVAIIHRNANNHRALCFESPLDRGRDLIGRFYPEPFGAKGLGKPDNIDGTKIHARCPPVFRHCLKADHVIRTVADGTKSPGVRGP
jgi:hypothetical protein